MSNEREIIDQLTTEFLEAFGAEKGCAILSSVVCQMYQETDQQSAMVLAQPASGIMVITTTMDCADQIPRIVKKTLEHIPSVLEQIEEGLDRGEEEKTLDFVDGETGEIRKPGDPGPTDKKLH